MTKKLAVLFDEDLRDRFDAYRIKYQMRNPELAKQLGTNTTAVSKYLNKKPEGNVVKLEALIADVLKAADEQADTDIFLFETSVSRSISHYCDVARKTKDFTLLHSPAGLGKTKGVELYRRTHPTCLHAELNMRNRDAAGVERLLFNQMDVKTWNPHATDRWTFMAKRLALTGRLIMIDNAQRITKSGLRWVYDFHDATKCPIALFGNPEILELIEPDDQQLSRTGIVQELELDDIEFVAMELAGQFITEAVVLRELESYIYQVAKEQGHLRSLHKQIILTIEILEAGFISDPCEAFESAHSQMIRSYPLIPA